VAVVPGAAVVGVTDDPGATVVGVTDDAVPSGAFVAGFVCFALACAADVDGELLFEQPDRAMPTAPTTRIAHIGLHTASAYRGTTSSSARTGRWSEPAWGSTTPRRARRAAPRTKMWSI
jgi:hypothetical protein